MKTYHLRLFMDGYTTAEDAESACIGWVNDQLKRFNGLKIEYIVFRDWAAYFVIQSESDGDVSSLIYRALNMTATGVDIKEMK